VQAVLRGGFVAVPAHQQPTLLIAVLIAIDEDLAAVMQPESIVLYFLPAFLDRALLVFDLGQQAVDVLRIFQHVLFGLARPGGVPLPRAAVFASGPCPGR
jgi:hypothetical protein